MTDQTAVDLICERCATRWRAHWPWDAAQRGCPICGASCVYEANAGEPWEADK